MELGWLGMKKKREQRGTWDKAVGEKRKERNKVFNFLYNVRYAWVR